MGSAPSRCDNWPRPVDSVPRFDVIFRRIEWSGDDVVWLAPHPDTGFRALIAAVSKAFPDCPPYGGAFTELVPHLTIGERMRDAADATSARLPVKAAVRAAQSIKDTMRRTPGRRSHTPTRT